MGVRPKGSEEVSHVDGEEKFRLRNSVDGHMPFNILHFMEVTRLDGTEGRLEERPESSPWEQDGVG